MNTRRIQYLVIVLVLLSVSVAACAAPVPAPAPAPAPTPAPAPAPAPAPVPEEIYEIITADWAAPNVEPWHKEVLEAIENESQGRLKMTMLYAGEHPYKSEDMLRAISEGLIDSSRPLSLVSSTSEPILAAIDLPFMWSGVQEFLDLLDNPEYADIKKVLLDDVFDKWNQISLVDYPSAGYCLAAPTYVTDWESLKGYRIRTYTKELDQMVSILGGTPVSLSWSEAYTGLQRGMIDGWVTSVSAPYRAKWYELAGEYTTIMDFAVGLFSLTINKDKWASLPPDLQDVIKKVTGDMTPYLREVIQKDNESGAWGAMRDYGIKFMYMPPAFKEEARAKMKVEIWEPWAESVGPPAPALLERIQEYHENYMKNQ